MKFSHIANFFLALTLVFSSTLYAETPTPDVDEDLTEKKGASCHGRFFNPHRDPNWLNFFPISILGISLGPNSNPPAMGMPPICICPSRMAGIPMPGIGITFWQPLYVAEIERSSGCLSTLGGLSLLKSFKMQDAEQDASDSAEDSTVKQTRMQMHWYQYPLFSILELFKELGCLSTSGFALGYITELDPTWHSDLWGAVLSPESALFANPLAQMACSVDAVASTISHPLDALFWCQGTSGPIYPLTGTSQHLNSNQQSNMQILGKFMAKAHRQLMLFATIGPGAECFSHPMPFIIKSQYRVNPIWPFKKNGKPINLGMSEYKWGLSPPANFATRESSAYLIWQGQQCCLRF